MAARRRILLGASDEDYVTVTSAAGRSLAAGLIRLADVWTGWRASDARRVEVASESVRQLTNGS
jgi:hypothetical protein